MHRLQIEPGAIAVAALMAFALVRAEVWLPSAVRFAEWWQR